MHEFKEACHQDLNQSFHQIVNGFLVTYVIVDGIDRNANTDHMEADWHPSNSIQKLITQVKEGVQFPHHCGIQYNMTNMESLQQDSRPTPCP